MMDCGVVDLHAATETVLDPVVGFGTTTMDEEEREMWLNTTDQDDLLGVNDAAASIFYSDFPSLPDFSCMSSSSSSSSTPALPLNNIACSTTTTSSCSSASSSSAAASWAVLKSDADVVEDKNGYMQHHQHQDQQDPIDNAMTTTTPVNGALSSTASMEISQQHDPAVIVGDCMDGVMEMDTFGYMELLEANEFFDPASIFQNEENDNPLVEFTQQQDPHATVLQNMELSATFQGTTEEDQILDAVTAATNNNEEEIIRREEEGGIIGGADDEMSMVFLEWLKSNKDSVSANDLRSVKLKRATIESAARRLGGGKEGMKQLLKLILEWVQTSHLQNKRRKENNNNIALPLQFLDPCQNQNTNGNSFAPDQSNSCFNQSTTTWLSQPPPPTNAPFGADQAPLMVAPFSQPMVGYMGDPYTASNNHNNLYQPAATEYHMMESTHPWPPHPNPQCAVASHYNQSFGDNSLLQPAAFGAYCGNQYPYQFFHGPGDRLMRLGPSATKEARKKRMARQRRVLSHHRHHSNHHQNQASDPHAMLGGDNCTTVMAANPANWMYWQQTMAPVVPTESSPAQQPVQQQAERSSVQTQNSCHQGRAASDRRQGWKPEKNLRFLLQKVLKQSDVGSLGRIVLPKKEAETHLPELEARDGISITMEDIGTSRVWNMRYRYWPNNKSRMYLLENTGDFVRANGLQEGDFIVIYSDVKCGKFMIRGVKVRQQGSKPETKKSGKSQKNQQNGINAATTAGGVVANNGISCSHKHKTEKGVI